MTLIFYYLENGTLPYDPLVVKNIVQKSSNYNILNGWLCWSSFLRPWLKCITPKERMVILIDIHEALCSSHEGAQTIAKKAFWQGYFWPSVVDDAKELVQTCKKF